MLILRIHIPGYLIKKKIKRQAKTILKQILKYEERIKNTKQNTLLKKRFDPLFF